MDSVSELRLPAEPVRRNWEWWLVWTPWWNLAWSLTSWWPVSPSVRPASRRSPVSGNGSCYHKMIYFLLYNNYFFDFNIFFFFFGHWGRGIHLLILLPNIQVLSLASQSACGREKNFRHVHRSCTKTNVYGKSHRYGWVWRGEKSPGWDFQLFIAY